MRYWNGELAVLDRVLRRAGEGHPSVLVVQGTAGTGKTSLLYELLERAEAFEVLSAVGVDGLQSSYAVLQQWDVPGAGAPENRQTPPFAAAQWLRARLDALPPNRPVLLTLDDLHWADPESVETLVWLLRRVRGDRLLVAVTTRPLTVDSHGEWQRLVRSAPDVTRLELDGLSLEAAGRLVASRWSEASPEAARALWTHTDGNPLYLTALLEEHGQEVLASASHLPAPQQFRELTGRRLLRLPPPARRLVCATAVLGDGWWPLDQAGQVAGIVDTSAATQAAIDAGLLEESTTDTVPAVRLTHALTRSAVYSSVPLPQRRGLHLRAAAAVSDVDASMEHRVAAVEQWDDGLAGELHARARVLHDEGAHRTAARYWGWASRLSSRPGDRRERHLEELLDRVPARLPVEADLAALGPSSTVTDQARVAVVRGTAHILGGRWGDAVSTLSAVDVTAVDDVRTRYRCTVLLAWAQANTGTDCPETLEALAQVGGLGVTEPAMEGLVYYARSIAAAHAYTPEQLVGLVPALPQVPSAVPLEGTQTLSWRGNLAEYRGHYPEAIRDLREVVARNSSRGIIVDPSQGGGHHAQLGAAYWMTGRWDEAKLWFRQSREWAMDGASLNSIARTLLPLHACGVGDLAEVDRQIEDVTGLLQAMPWQEALQSLLRLRVVRLHAAGTTVERGRLMAELHDLWPDVVLDAGMVSAPWLMHATLAWLWAGDSERAQAVVDRMAGLDQPARWVGSAASWLRGLLAEQRGDLPAAADLLRAGTTDAFTLPFYRAHAQVDRARVARALGNDAEAHAAHTAALAAYTALGARPYVERLGVERQALTAGGPSTLAGSADLTDREQDVYTLLVSGLSYVQIARELFITRSTVSYHLGNIYAKTGVRTRHELVQASRAGRTA